MRKAYVALMWQRGKVGKHGTTPLALQILLLIAQQRETLLNSHAKLHGVDDAIDKSKKVLTSMSRRMSKNKWILASLIGALVLAIIFILYYKLSH
ncbi:hypothetical protein R6Q59_002807 [Mikania micrantha]